MLEAAHGIRRRISHMGDGVKKRLTQQHNEAAKEHAQQYHKASGRVAEQGTGREFGAEGHFFAYEDPFQRFPSAVSVAAQQQDGILFEKLAHR